MANHGPARAGPYAAAALAQHYSRFRVTERILLTGHSHQAWPDVAFDAQQRAWLDAADLVDDKWERAALIADEVRAGWRRLLNDRDGEIALGQNTHELIVRLLSAILMKTGATGTPRTPLISRRTRSAARLVTSDGEFHTIRRQIDRLAEAGIDVVKVAARPVETLAERLGQATDDGASCVLVSSVLFETAEIVPDLGHLAAACEHAGATLVVDAYHQLNVVPFDLHAERLSRAFIVGGGYKYCQMGEGNCFMRVPAGCDLRPVITGWFSEFSELAAARSPGHVGYGEGAARFAGATYDPTAHYRGAAVFRFHADMGLHPVRLREISRHQTATLERAIRALDLDPAVAEIVDVAAERRAGFLAVRTPHAARIVSRMRARGVYVDARGDMLRIGPAPYVSDDQLHRAVALLEEQLKPNGSVG
jgi:kynureninase